MPYIKHGIVFTMSSGFTVLHISVNIKSILQLLRSQALTPVGSVLTLFPYSQKILSLLLKHIQNLTIFPPHCYQASHHHPSFRLVILLTGPCFSPCPLSVCASHNSRMNKKGHLPRGSKMALPTLHL